MSLAVLILSDGSIKPIADQRAAINLYTAWKSNKPATEAQKAFIQKVKSIHLPPSWRPEGYNDTPQVIGAVNDTWIRETQGKDAASGKD